MLVMESKDFKVKFNDSASFPVKFDESENMVVDMGPTIEREYHGAYEVTPTAETQTLTTANRVLTQNIVVDPIPSNYGLITWNGSYLTVS